MNKFKKNIISLFFLATVFSFTVGITSCASSSVNSHSSEQNDALPKDLSVVEGKLENEMSYLIKRNAEPDNRVYLRLVLNVGSAMEEDDQQGVAHLIEHLMYNGTENFPKNDIIHYFEKIGMKFGPSLNAFTSFEQTVFELEFPAENSEYLKTSLQILQEIATTPLFLQEEIDKERGIVLEEYRIHKENINGRVHDSLYPFLLEDSILKDRFAIGKPEIIKNVSRQRIVDFFNKWYRPEFMTLIAVGDLKVEVLEKAIKESMSLIPASDKSVKLPHFDDVNSTKKEIKFFHDPELKYSQINFYSKVDLDSEITNYSQFEKNCQINVATTILTNRLNEITNTQESPWVGAAINSFYLTNNNNFGEMYFVAKDGMIIQSFKTLFDEIDKICNFGITQTELNRIKELLLSNAKLYMENTNKQLSSDIANQLIDCVRTGSNFISPEQTYKLTQRFVNEVTVESINQTFAKIYGERGSKILLILPENAQNIPTEKEMMNIWENYQNPELQAYEDSVDDDDLMEKPSTKGKIISKKQVKHLGATEYILENGVKIITKKTDFDNNLIKMSVASQGGSVYVSDEDFPSVSIVLNYVLCSGLNGMNQNELFKKISTKQVNLTYAINQVTENFNGISTRQDFEILLQLVNLIFTKPEFNDNGWNIAYNQLYESAKNFGVRPEDIFLQKINQILYNDIRHSPLNLEYLKKINKESAKKIYYERFGNIGDFSFSFVGDFDEKELIDLCQTYLGTIPSNEKHDECLYKYYDFPKGITSEVVKKGISENGQVSILFGGKLPKAHDVEEVYKDSFISLALIELMNTKLREQIREEKSGTYKINFGGFIDGYPERYYLFSVDFSCEPEREEELANEVRKVIKTIQENEISNEDINKIVELTKRNFEVYKYNNDWWLQKINGYLFNYEPDWAATKIDKKIKLITSENLSNAAKKYLKTENYVEVFLKPEK